MVFDGPPKEWRLQRLGDKVQSVWPHMAVGLCTSAVRGSVCSSDEMEHLGETGSQ